MTGKRSGFPTHETELGAKAVKESLLQLFPKLTNENVEYKILKIHKIKYFLIYGLYMKRI